MEKKNVIGKNVDMTREYLKAKLKVIAMALPYETYRGETGNPFCEVEDILVELKVVKSKEPKYSKATEFKALIQEKANPTLVDFSQEIFRELSERISRDGRVDFHPLRLTASEIVLRQGNSEYTIKMCKKRKKSFDI